MTNISSARMLIDENLEQLNRTLKLDKQRQMQINVGEH